MKEIVLTEEDLIAADNQATAMGALPNSHTGGEKNVVGKLAEIAFQKFKPEAILLDNFDHDFRLNNKTIEVKSRTFKFTPPPDYEFAPARINQAADFFVFIGVQESFQKAWICGWLSQKEMLDRNIVTEIKEGERMGDGNTYKASKYRILIKNMHQEFKDD